VSQERAISTSLLRRCRTLAAKGRLVVTSVVFCSEVNRSLFLLLCLLFELFARIYTWDKGRKEGLEARAPGKYFKTAREVERCFCGQERAAGRNED